MTDFPSLEAWGCRWLPFAHHAPAALAELLSDSVVALPLGWDLLTALDLKAPPPSCSVTALPHVEAWGRRWLPLAPLAPCAIVEICSDLLVSLPNGAELLKSLDLEVPPSSSSSDEGAGLLSPLGLWATLGLLALPLDPSGPFVTAAAPAVAPCVTEPHGPRVSQQSASSSLLNVVCPNFFEGAFLTKISVLEVLGYAGSVVLCGIKLAPSACCLYALGASWAPAIAAGAVWRLVTPILLHANFQHLAFNLLFQLRLGYQVESELGSWRFALVYLGSGIFGNLMSAAIDPWKLSVGASTSGLGIMGATVALLILHWERYPPSHRAWIIYLGAILSGLMLSAHTDAWGHLGGFIGGLGLTILLSPGTTLRNVNGHPRIVVNDSLAHRSLRVLSFGMMLAFTARSGQILLDLPIDDVHPVLQCPSLL